jgi:peptide/nickel transport system substrate-binding protein
MKEAQAELDDTKRRELYVEMQGIVRDQGGALVLLFADDVLARSD